MTNERENTTPEPDELDSADYDQINRDAVQGADPDIAVPGASDTADTDGDREQTPTGDAKNSRDDTTSIDPRSDPPTVDENGKPIANYVDRDPGEDATTVNGGNADR